MRILRLGSTVGLLLALLVAPQRVPRPHRPRSTIDIVFDVSEDFTATGGVLCASGTAVTDPVFAAGFGRMGRGAGPST